MLDEYLASYIYNLGIWPVISQYESNTRWRYFQYLTSRELDILLIHNIVILDFKNSQKQQTNAMGNYFSWNAQNIAPRRHIVLLERLREALNCEITLSESQIGDLTTELTFDDKTREGVHIPSYLAELKRRQIDSVSKLSSVVPRLPEKVDEFDEAQAVWQSAEYIVYKTAYTNAALILALNPARIGFRAEFGNSVRYPSSHTVSEAVEIDFDRLADDWAKIKGESNYKHRKPAYVSWLRTLVTECGSEEQMEQVEEFFDSLDELLPKEDQQKPLPEDRQW